MRHEDEDDESSATLTSIHAGDVNPGFSGEGYEPWLFQTMLNELSERELGVGFIYSILDLFATRHGLSDVAVVLVNEGFGTQMFRLGGEAVTTDMAAHLNASPGVYCEPDTVPSAECDAVRTACQLALSLHLARFSAAHRSAHEHLESSQFRRGPRRRRREERSLRLGLHLGIGGP